MMGASSEVKGRTFERTSVSKDKAMLSFPPL